MTTQPAILCCDRATLMDRDWVRSLNADGLRLRRSWPRSAGRLLLEVADPTGARIAGQWFANPEQAHSVARHTPGSSRRGSVVLQPGGADRKLTPLTELLTRRGHRLVAHRPERRAVITTGDSYLKVLRPQRQPAAVARARTAEGLGLRVPRVVADDPVIGSLTTRALPGVPLTDLLAGDSATNACLAVGRSLARLHETPIPAAGADTGLERHGPDDELAVLDRWLGHARDHRLPTGPVDVPRLPQPHRWTLIHRDFHDGQVIMDNDRVGILDFDLLAIGDPALDLANFLAHLGLRAEQGLLSDPDTAIAATLAGYCPDPAVRAALPGYLSAANARLRVVYAFRDPELVS
ncbi:MAG TPA: phosphotransferase [Microlunatus sp.]